MKISKFFKIKENVDTFEINLKDATRLFVLRCLAKTIDVVLTSLLMVLMIVLYSWYAFEKIKNYLVSVYTTSIESYEISQTIIDERTINLEQSKTIFELVQLFFKYTTLDVGVTWFTIVFLGGYITFYFIAMFFIEFLFVNKKGQTIGKRICNIRLSKGRRWWDLLTRGTIIYFVQWFLCLTYIVRYKKKRAMAHEHLFDNYVVFDFDHEMKGEKDK